MDSVNGRQRPLDYETHQHNNLHNMSHNPREFLNDCVVVYFDDTIIFSKILVFSKILETYAKSITENLRKGINLKKKKCEFGVKEIYFLGHVIKDAKKTK